MPMDYYCNLYKYNIQNTTKILVLQQIIQSNTQVLLTVLLLGIPIQYYWNLYECLGSTVLIYNYYYYYYTTVVTFVDTVPSVCLPISHQGLIFVVDSNDPERIKEAATELHRMVQSLLDLFLFMVVWIMVKLIRTGESDYPAGLERITVVLFLLVGGGWAEGRGRAGDGQ